RDLKDTEGYVIRFATGKMTKIKCDWYVQIHKAKEAILQDRNIIELILDQKLDDIKPHLLQDDLDRLNEFESQVNSSVVHLSKRIYDIAKRNIENGDRKTFALGEGTELNGSTRAIIFKLWDKLSEEYTLELVTDTIRNNIKTNSKWDSLKNE